MSTIPTKDRTDFCYKDSALVSPLSSATAGRDMVMRTDYPGATGRAVL